ncbi:MAG TPA: hypothetical protein VKB04_10050, partial [Anaerolineales bacterium]|nr:hypothetical protein [Anaerolineales bacterium]
MACAALRNLRGTGAIGVTTYQWGCILYRMDFQAYIPGLSPVEPGPLARFTPPLEEGVVSAWLPLHTPAGSWVLDPFGFSPRLALEAAR